MDTKKDKKSKMKKLEEKITVQKKTAWNRTKDFNKDVFEFCDGYKNFMDQSKTVRQAIFNIVKSAKANGFSSLDEAKEFNKKGKYYISEKGKHAALILIGKEPLSSGLRMIVSHVDSPRLDFKPYPFYEETDLSLMKSHYYGGIKKYQWVNWPLTLYCRVVMESGKNIEFTIGDKKDDPVFVIPDLLPHLSREQDKKASRKVISGEDLNIIVGSIPVDDEDVKEKVKMNILKHLYDEYGIIEEDFVSAEVEAVPCIELRDVGFDRGLMGAYGHDDKSCVYASLMSTFVSIPKKTTIVLFEDKEEIGSMGNTSARSEFFKRIVGKIILLNSGKSSEHELRDILSKSEGISGDVTAGMNPTFKSVHDALNASVLGKGVAVEKSGGYGGKFSGNDANPEFVAKIRNMLNKNKIAWQSGELGKVDEGGGGTVAMFFANYGIDIIDIGPAVLAMHSPFEIISKADLYSTYLAYKGFIENM